MKIFRNIYFFFLSFLCLMAACQSGNKKNDLPADNAQTNTDSVINSGGLREDSAFSEGARLIAKNDCFTCHKIEEQSIGPSYQAIAKKYELNEANVQNLAYKIRHGSIGAWGNVEMTAHPLVSETEAQKMASYILSLR